MQPQRAPHDVRHDDVALDLVNPEEEQDDPDRRERVHDELVEERRQGAQPRAEIRDQLRHGHPRAEQDGIAVGARSPAERPEHP